VRLDHLLSKELHRTSSAGVFTGECSVRAGAGGGGPQYLPGVQVRLVLGGGRGLLEKSGNTGQSGSCPWLGMWVGGTLLGPEGTTLWGCRLGRSMARISRVGGVGVGSCGR
jgi:hypothetical protein